MKYYIAYGSNLNIVQMKWRCPQAVPFGKAILEGYKLVFRRGYLTIEPDEGSFVPVGVWKVNSKDERALDRYEGFPKFYRKETILLSFAKSDGTMCVDQPCMVYIMNDGFPVQMPTLDYLQTVTHGYMDFGFDALPLKDAYMETANS